MPIFGKAVVNLLFETAPIYLSINLFIRRDLPEFWEPYKATWIDLLPKGLTKGSGLSL